MDNHLSTSILLLLLLIQATDCEDTYFQGPNVALGKYVTQSPGTYHNLYPANLAVDGNTDTVLYQDGGHFCTHTAPDRVNQSASWTVDLGQYFIIKGIRIFNRKDRDNDQPEDYKGRLRDFTVIGIPAAPGAAVLLYDDRRSQPQMYRETIINITVTSQTPFRRITVAIPARLTKEIYLTLCEVQIFPVLCKFQTVVPPLRTQLVANTGAVIERQYVTQRAQIQFSCQAGLHLKILGSSTLTCQDDGNYDYRAPTCEKITPCPKPTIRSHVRYISIKHEYYPGDSLSWSCEAGFSPQTTQQLTCSQSSTWSGTTPSCSPLTCPHPGLLDKGHYLKQGQRYTSGSVAVGTSVTVTCSTGYRPSVDDIQCTQSSTWNTPQPICSPMTCPYPGPLEHGHYVNQLGQNLTSGRVDLGTSVAVSCSTGYKPSADAIRCIQTSNDARWDQTSNCTQITCLALNDNRLNGGKYYYGTTDLSSQGYVFGTLAKAVCLSNFTFVGEENLRTCGASGTWTGAPGACELASQHEEEKQANPITVIAGAGAGGVLLGIVIVVIIIVVYKRRVKHNQNETGEASAETKTTSSQPEATDLHEVNTYLNTSLTLPMTNDYEEPSRPDSPDQHSYASLQDVQYENDESTQYEKI